MKISLLLVYEEIPRIDMIKDVFVTKKGSQGNKINRLMDNEFFVSNNTTMKNYLILLVCLMLGSPVWAQFEIQTSLGPSLPVGKYGSDRIDEGGYAKVGLGAELDIYYFITENFGVQGILAFQSHQIDEDDLESDFIQSFLASSVDLVTGKYSTSLFMVGPFYRFYPYDIPRLAWTFRGGAGLLRGSIDNFVVNVESELGTLSSSSPEDRASMFSYFLGTDLIYFFNDEKKIGFRVGAAFSNARPDFSIGLPEEVSRDEIRNISFVNLNFGLAFRF